MAGKKKVLPTTTDEIKEVPKETEGMKELPVAENKVKELPKVTEKKKELPAVGNPENTVKIGDALIEIKPTKVRYQRDMTANFYRALELYPIVEILSWDERVVGDGRDGDKAQMDWLIAVTDNPELIKQEYNNMDTELIEKLVVIFKRVNKIDEKEEKRKNIQREKITE